MNEPDKDRDEKGGKSHQYLPDPEEPTTEGGEPDG